MKFAVAVLALIATSGCAAKKPHQQHLFRFEGVKDGNCEEDVHRSHWDAKTGAFVIVCKP